LVLHFFLLRIPNEIKESANQASRKNPLSLIKPLKEIVFRRLSKKSLHPHLRIEKLLRINLIILYAMFGLQSIKNLTLATPVAVLAATSLYLVLFFKVGIDVRTN